MNHSKIIGFIWATIVIISIPAVYGMALLSLMAFDSAQSSARAFFFVAAHWLYGPIAIISVFLFWKFRSTKSALSYLLVPLYYPMIWVVLSLGQPNYNREKCAKVASDPLCSKQSDGAYLCKDPNPNFAGEIIHGCN